MLLLMSPNTQAPPKPSSSFLSLLSTPRHRLKSKSPVQDRPNPQPALETEGRILKFVPTRVKSFFTHTKHPSQTNSEANHQPHVPSNIISETEISNSVSVSENHPPANHLQDGGQPSTGKTALEVFKIALTALDKASLVIPHGAVLSPAISGVLLGIDIIEKKYENAEVLSDLADRINRLIPIISPLYQKSADLSSFFSKLNSLFKGLSQDVQDKKSQGTLLQLIHSKDNVSSLEKCRRKLDAIIDDANLALTADIWDHLKLEDQRRRFALLNPVKKAAFNSDERSGSHSCDRDTRTGVLQVLHDWIESDESKLFWLHGPAGAGKSTIAHTISEHYKDTNNLGATFFFSRDDHSRRGSTLLLQTIAYQLGRAFPPLEKAISNALINPDIVNQRWEDQLKKLILDPISQMAVLLPSRLVVVIDALDECEKKKDVLKIIEAIVTCLRTEYLTTPLRFLVTSRDEMNLFHLFHEPSIKSATSPFDLYTIDSSNAKADIQTFFNHRLKRLRGIDPDWPTPADVDYLVDISEGLFIAASTLLRFLDSPKHNAKYRYEKLRSGNKISGLDSMYAQILSSAMSDVDVDENEGHFKLVIGTIALASSRLTLQALGDLLGIDVDGHLYPILATLRPVIHVPETNNGVVHTFHSSFIDFLVDSKRCTDNRFFIEPTLHHALLARFCLKRVRSKNSDYFPKTATKVGGDLVYACCYWGDHFVKSNVDGSLVELLNVFSSNHLLFWIETLSRVGDLNGGKSALKVVKKKLKPKHRIPRRTTHLLDDAVFFLEDFHNILALSAIHTYTTALPLSPKGSALYRRYGVELEFARKAVTYHNAQWELINPRRQQ